MADLCAEKYRGKYRQLELRQEEKERKRKIRSCFWSRPIGHCIHPIYETQTYPSGNKIKWHTADGCCKCPKIQGKSFY